MSSISKAFMMIFFNTAIGNRSYVHEISNSGAYSLCTETCRMGMPDLNCVKYVKCIRIFPICLSAMINQIVNKVNIRIQTSPHINPIFIFDEKASLSNTGKISHDKAWQGKARRGKTNRHPDTVSPAFEKYCITCQDVTNWAPKIIGQRLSPLTVFIQWTHADHMPNDHPCAKSLSNWPHIINHHLLTWVTLYTTGLDCTQPCNENTRTWSSFPEYFLLPNGFITDCCWQWFANTWLGVGHIHD